MDETDEITPLHFLEAVYCNPNLPLATRLRAAIEAAPYKHAKLSVSAVAHMNKEDFATALDRAIARSQGPLLLNSTVEELPASELKKPFVRSNYRRY
jgi:hypothetical protein